ncbi:hypothetical protein [Pseudaquabacterium rugosum]|uniref:Uncharacterized protein n=1 Tax=Pseudaquabacterium rugosum TaxID=2984194 RepID=A0ABU9BBF2_9BURK
MAAAQNAALAAQLMGGPAAAANPYAAAASAAVQLGSAALAGPNESGSGQFDLRSSMDGSGWTISTGGSTSKAERTTTETSGATGQAQQFAGLGLDSGMVMPAAFGLVLFLILRG